MPLTIEGTNPFQESIDPLISNQFIRGVTVKRNAFLCCTLLLFGIFSAHAISQGKTAFGINAGIGVWRMMSLEESFRVLENKLRPYPIGFNLGGYVENPLSGDFSIVNELSYRKSITAVVTDPGADNLYQRVAMGQIVLPVLVKYNTSWPSVSYFLFGPSVGYLIDANYVFDDDNAPKGSAEITKDLPAISTALEFGVGKGVKISGGELQLEVRGEWGFTRFDYQHYANDFIPDIGSWKNGGLQFIIGYKLD